MTNTDRRRPTLAAACTAGLLALGACGDGGQSARLDKIERRLDVLEQRVGTGSGLSPATTQSSPGAPPATGITPSTPKVDSSVYAEGAVAVVHAAPANAQGAAEPPADSVGGFVYTGGPLVLHDQSSRGVRYAGLTGVELQGWLKATEAGRYQIGEDIHGSSGGDIAGANCVLNVWLEDRMTGMEQGVLPTPGSNGAEQRVSLVTGANLQPGLYKLRLWTVCTSPTPRKARITVDLLLKAPSDLNLRGFRSDELLHKR